MACLQFMSMILVSSIPAFAFDCKPRFPEVVYYGRSGKAGSTTLLRTLAASTKNRHRHYSSTKYTSFVDGTSSNKDSVEEALRHITALHNEGWKYVSYDQHMGWLNFSLSGQRQPVFINLLREPIETAVSHYYAILYSYTNAIQYRASLPPEQRNWSINQCLEAGQACQTYPLVVTKLNRMSQYFCGYHPDCALTGVDNVTLSAAGMARAIHHLHNEYLLVGITERYDDSLKLFKRLLPTYFSAVNEKKPAPRHNSNSERPKNEELSPKAKRVLRQGSDHQLYAIALELFDTKYRACFPD
eukprot:m.112330 g.112330  ORF g.112330 m.112330 type:complete len:300 (-) comp15406_c0_seq19:42-941(-)